MVVSTTLKGGRGAAAGLFCADDQRGQLTARTAASRRESFMRGIVGRFEVAIVTTCGGQYGPLQIVKLFDPQRSVLTQFRALAEAAPDRIALVDGTTAVTFGEVWVRAGSIAARILGSGVVRGDVVALALPRSIELMIATIAVLRAGGVVLAIDLKSPSSRNAAILRASAATRILYRGHLDDVLAVVPAIDLADTGSAALDAREEADRGPLDVAFLVYTSGSTGEPKGVRVAYDAVRLRAAAEMEGYALTDDSVYLARSRPNLIAHMVALAILSTSTRCAIPRDDAPDDPRTVFDLVTSLGVTELGLPPRFIDDILKDPDFPQRLARLRTLRSYGDALSLPAASALCAQLPACSLKDDYGATEVSGIVAVRRFSRSDDGMAHRPLANVLFRVVDESGEDATEGELWIGGPFVAPGYVDGGDDARFVEIDHEGSKAHFYRTGDRARLGSGGTFSLLGRMDLVLNVDGVRIDPVEVERALCAHRNIRDAAVWAHPDQRGRLRLTAHIVEDGPPTHAAVVRTFLSSRLPGTHIPTRFVHARSLPKTPSGKLQRTALEPSGIDRVNEPPSGPIEHRLLDLFRSTLGEPSIGVTGDFFEWGGDSLRAFALVSRANQEFRVALAAATLLNAATVRDLACIVETAKTEPRSEIRVTTLRAGGDREPLFCFPGGAGDPLWFLPLEAALDPGRGLLGVSYERLALPVTMRSILDASLDALRREQPGGPYFLLGHSLGGVLAFEVARALRLSGEQIAFLGLIDTYLPGATYQGTRDPARRLGHGLKRLVNRLRRQHRRFIDGSDAAPPPSISSALADGLRVAVRSHRIERADLFVNFFRAKVRPDGADLSAPWADVAGRGMEVVEVPGEHFDLIGRGRAIELSARISAAILRVDPE